MAGSSSGVASFMAFHPLFTMLYWLRYPNFGKDSSTELHLERGPYGGASVSVAATSDNKSTRVKKHSHSVEEWAQALRYAAKSSMKE